MAAVVFTEVSTQVRLAGTGLPEQLAAELRSIPGYVDDALEDSRLGVHSARLNVPDGRLRGDPEMSLSRP